MAIERQKVEVSEGDDEFLGIRVVNNRDSQDA